MHENVSYAIRTANTSSNGWGVSEELAHTLDTTGPEAVVALRGGQSEPTVLKLRHTGSPNVGGGQGAMWQDGVSFTLATHQDQTLFQPIGFCPGVSTTGHLTVNEGFSPTVRAQANSNTPAVITEGTVSKYIVRRLMPIECERLQGMPDNYTDIAGCDVDAVTEKVAASLGYDEAQKAKLRRKITKWSKETPDAPRYKSIGNSMAVPVMMWIGQRIEKVQEIIDTMESQ